MNEKNFSREEIVLSIEQVLKEETNSNLLDTLVNMVFENPSASKIAGFIATKFSNLEDALAFLNYFQNDTLPRLGLVLPNNTDDQVRKLFENRQQVNPKISSLPINLNFLKVPVELKGSIDQALQFIKASFEIKIDVLNEWMSQILKYQPSKSSVDLSPLFQYFLSDLDLDTEAIEKAHYVVRVLFAVHHSCSGPKITAPITLDVDYATIANQNSDLSVLYNLYTSNQLLEKYNFFMVQDKNNTYLADHFKNRHQEYLATLDRINKIYDVIFAISDANDNLKLLIENKADKSTVIQSILDTQDEYFDKETAGNHEYRTFFIEQLIKEIKTTDQQKAILTNLFRNLQLRERLDRSLEEDFLPTDPFAPRISAESSQIDERQQQLITFLDKVTDISLIADKIVELFPNAAERGNCCEQIGQKLAYDSRFPAIEALSNALAEIQQRQQKNQFDKLVKFFEEQKSLTGQVVSGQSKASLESIRYNIFSELGKMNSVLGNFQNYIDKQVTDKPLKLFITHNITFYKNDQQKNQKRSADGTDTPFVEQLEKKRNTPPAMEK